MVNPPGKQLLIFLRGSAPLIRGREAFCSRVMPEISRGAVFPWVFNSGAWVGRARGFFFGPNGPLFFRPRPTVFLSWSLARHCSGANGAFIWDPGGGFGPISRSGCVWALLPGFCVPLAAPRKRAFAGIGTPIQTGPTIWRKIIYIDHYANAVTGLRQGFVNPTFVYQANSVYLNFARTFADVPPGDAFWYINSNGMVEMPVNKGNAADKLGLGLGTQVYVSEGSAGSGAFR